MKRFVLVSVISLVVFAWGCSSSGGSEGGETGKDVKEAKEDVEEVKGEVSPDTGKETSEEDTMQEVVKEVEDFTDTSEGTQEDVIEEEFQGDTGTGEAVEETTGDPGSEQQQAYAPEGLAGFQIEFIETEHNVDNIWTFQETKATLKDVGDFDYTYERKDPTHSVVIFDVDGKDKYEMEWTSEDGGNCTESFSADGKDWSPPSPCEFHVLQRP